MVATTEHRGLDRRRRLVGAAREVFAADGIGPGSMAAVADRAGIGREAALTLFANEVELFAAVCEHEFLHTSLLVTEAFARREDPWEGISDAVATLLDRACEPAVQRITAIQGPEVLGWERMHEISATFCLPVIEGGLRRLADRRQLQGHDLPVLAGLLHGALLRTTLQISRAADQAAARGEIERELHELLLGLARPPAR